MKRHLKRSKKNKTIEYFAKKQINNSKIESAFQKTLKELNIKYKRQFILENKIYDFVCVDKKIVIEFDGDYWHWNPKINKGKPNNKKIAKNIINDAVKNMIAFRNGYQIYRVWENDYKNKYIDMKSKLNSFYNEYDESKLHLLK